MRRGAVRQHGTSHHRYGKRDDQIVRLARHQRPARSHRCAHHDGGKVTTGGGVMTLGGDVTGNASAPPHHLRKSLSGRQSPFTIATERQRMTCRFREYLRCLHSYEGRSRKTRALGEQLVPGLTTVSAGVLNIQHANGLGTTAAGTTVSNGAALEIQGGSRSAPKRSPSTAAASRRWRTAQHRRRELHFRCGDLAPQPPLQPTRAALH